MPVWEKTKHSSKAAFDKGWAAFERLGAPVNKLTNKIGSEAFWPQGLGPESDKAARILRSFCKDGFYQDGPTMTGAIASGPEPIHQGAAGPGYPGTGYPVTGPTGPAGPNYPGPGYPATGPASPAGPSYPGPGYPATAYPEKSPAGPGYPATGYPATGPTGPGGPASPGYPASGPTGGPGGPKSPGYQGPGYPTPGGPASPGYPAPGYPAPGGPASPGYPGPGYPAPVGPASPGYPAPGYPAPGNPATAPTATNTPNTGSGENPSSPGPKNKPKVLVKIPQKVIQNCVGLAVFTVMRAGLWVSGAGGSGVLIARKEDGNWGPPSGILVHTLGVGFMAGIDIYDCVIVINNRKALEAFKTMRVSLGGELSVVAGPVGAGGILEAELIKNSKKPIFSYVKSRGLYGGLQIDGTIIVERNDENAKFYGERLPISKILAGQVMHVPVQTRMLMEVVKQAEGRTDVDNGVVDQASHIPPPSDLDVEKMSEPTQDQKNNFAPPPHYDSNHPGASSPLAAHDEKTGLLRQQANSGPSPGEAASYGAPQTYPTQSYGDQPGSGFGAQTTGKSKAPVVRFALPHNQSTAAHAPAVDSDGFPIYDPTQFGEAPVPTRDEKAGLGTQQAYSSPAHGETFGHGALSSHPSQGHGSQHGLGPQTTGTPHTGAGIPNSTLPYRPPGAHAPAVDSDGFPAYDPTLYDPPTPQTTGSSHPLPLGHPLRTDSGFAPPPPSGAPQRPPGRKYSERIPASPDRLGARRRGIRARSITLMDRRDMLEQVDDRVTS